MNVKKYLESLSGKSKTFRLYIESTEGESDLFLHMSGSRKALQEALQNLLLQDEHFRDEIFLALGEIENKKINN